MKSYKRLSDSLISYWEDLRGSKILPPESAIDTSELEEVWKDCFLLEVSQSGEYKYDYMGKNLIEAYGSNESDILLSPYADEVTKKFDDVIKVKQPISDSGEFRNSDNVLIKYRQILLPFGSSEGVVKNIFGGMRWRAF